LFTKEIEEALLDRRIDLAVHSLKDMPADVPEGLAITAIPEREDPRDALLGAPLAAGVRVGTSSLRRSAQLNAMGIGITTEMLRGNVDTRIRKLDEGQYDAIVLAAAGLRRLGLADRIRETLPVEVMCPAVGQGALAIETRCDSGHAEAIARKLDHAETRATVTAERAMLATLGWRLPGSDRRTRGAARWSGASARDRRDTGWIADHSGGNCRDRIQRRWEQS
jgi:hydroxymethylbilane synthase